jgi:hypothetical protein
LRFRVLDLELRVQGIWFRVQSLTFIILGVVEVEVEVEASLMQ